MKILPVNKQEDNEEKMEKRADILFPSMKDKKKSKTSKKSLLGKSIFGDETDEDKNQIKKETKNLSDNNTKQDLTKPTPLLKAYIEKSDLKLSDQNFVDSMDIVFENEGGFSNHKNDKGGRTNMGITQKTYDDYCKRHGLEKKDVKNLTRNEAVEVYYNDYWKASGADKIDNREDALILFDTAVLHGVGKAKQFYKQANGNSDKMLELRKEHYLKKVQSDPTQNDFLKGWNNRVNKLDKILKESKKTN